MGWHLTQHRQGFGAGLTMITDVTADDPTGIGVGVLKLGRGEVHEVTPASETAWLLMHGKVEVQAGARIETLIRRSLFDESPSCVHAAAGTPVSIRAVEDTELTLYRTANVRPFAPRIYLPADVPNEHRGKGQVGDTCYRYVRTIFDRNNADSAAELVLGEVVTMPGKWSSYPPHHHPQPEIYHYRFTEPQGFGFAQLGADALQVKQYDTVKIPSGVDHAQAAAPGYGMYYSWVIRHLPDNPYTVPEFTKEHAWIMQPGAKYWTPEGAK